MAEGNGIPKLKRKRESVEPQRKKTKTQRKSNATDAGVEAIQSQEVAAQELPLASKLSPKPQTKKDVKSTPQKSLANGGPANPATSTPGSSRGEKKSKSKAQENKGSHTSNAHVEGADKPETPSLKAKVEHGESAEALQNRSDGQSESKQAVDQQPGPKDKRRDKGKKKAGLDVKKESETVEHLGTLSTLPVNGNAVFRPTKKERKQKKQKDKASNPWSLSLPEGGWFLPQDPVFSSDEKYLLLGKLKALEVYSTETSLLIRELHVGGSGVVLAYAMSSVKSDQVYIADSSGIITLWNWTDGSKIGRWDIGASVRHLAAVQQPSASQDLVYSHEAGTSHVINVHALRTGNEASKTELKRILKTSKPINSIQVLLKGKIVIVSSTKSIMIGKRMKLHKTALQDFEYTWREFETSKYITTFNAYVRTPASDKGKDPQLDPRDHLDLAIGDEEGVIYLFEDIISSFAAIERSQKDKTVKKIGLESLRPKRLHWHREAVGSVKWSLDGNYLISGGDETVLTIWQLATGKQQHLPHLTAAIENVVVSPAGASYGLSLANNSVIVLSTSELKPKTNIIGIQSRRIDLEQKPRESNLNNYAFDLFSAVPMVVDSKNSNHVIFAAPSSQPRPQRVGYLPEPYAQTFDIATHRPVARQALTRNNATDPNLAPEGKKIQEPDIKLMQISRDGAWLATVDEWIPPRNDMRYVEEGIPSINEVERSFRREVYLKIWRREEKTEQWVLDARIDAPHFSEGVSAHDRVFDLVADPSGTGFATVGEDRYVRIWKPKTRTRDGMVVRGADRTQGLVTWSLSRSVKLADKVDIAESNQSHQDTAMQSSRLAFSADGSVLAAGVSWASDVDMGVIHIIDTDGAVIQRSITEIGTRSLSGLGFSSRYLVVVGSSVTVWDTVMDELVYTVPIETPGIDEVNRVRLVRLAIDEDDGTFAVSMPRFEKMESLKTEDTRRFLKASSKLSIFDPSQQKPTWTRNIQESVLALAPAKGRRGYIALDSSSGIRIITPKSTTVQLPTPPPEPAQPAFADSTNVVQDDQDSEEEPLEGRKSDVPLEFLQDSENDKPVVRPEELQVVFESGSSHALPPVKDLFDAVVGLYARKPRATATT